MKQWIKENAALIALLLIGVICAGVIAGGRAAVEEAGKHYDYVVDYDDFSKMVLRSEQNEAYWLSVLKSEGVDKIAVTELSAKELNKEGSGDIYAYQISELKAEFGWKDRVPERIVSLAAEAKFDNDALIIVTDSELFELLSGRYTERLDGATVTSFFENGAGYIYIATAEEKSKGVNWTMVPVMLPADIVETALEAGFQIIPRTVTVKGANGAGFQKAVLKDFAEFNSPYYFGNTKGYEGYESEDWLENTVEYLNKTGASPVIVEQADQSENYMWPGVKELLGETDYQAVRLFSEPDYIQAWYATHGYSGPEEITNSIARAICDRSCRLIYLRMIMKNDKSGDYVTDEAEYHKLLGGVREQVGRLGYTQETLKPLKTYYANTVLRIFLGIGAIAAAVIMLDLFVRLNTKAKYILLAVGALGVAGAMFVIPNGSKLLLSMGSGIVMPVIAIAGINRYLTKNRADDLSFKSLLLRDIGLTFALCAVCFCGSLFATAAISDTEYMLELRIYRGVKLMQLIPIALFFVSYIQVFLIEKHFGRFAPFDTKENKRLRRLEVREKSAEFLNRSVLMKDLVVIAAVAAVGAVMLLLGLYYIERTGNSDNVSTLEIMFRNMLEVLLRVRPRTKEFLVGWPCVMMFIWAVRRRIPLLPAVFGAGASAGAYVSIVNTFLHIRNPFLTNVERTVTGLVIGVVICAAAVCVCELIYNFAAKKGRDKTV